MKAITCICAALLMVATGAFAATGTATVTEGDGSYIINVRGSAALADDGIDTTVVVLADLPWVQYDNDGAARVVALTGFIGNTDDAGDSSQCALDTGVPGAWVASHTLANDGTNLNGAEGKAIVITAYGPNLRIILKNVSGAAERMQHVLAFVK